MTADLALEKVAVLHVQASSAETLTLRVSGTEVRADPSATVALDENALNWASPSPGRPEPVSPRVQAHTVVTLGGVDPWPGVTGVIGVTLNVQLGGNP